MAIQQRTNSLYARAQGLMDQVVSPATREQYWDNTRAFAQEQPLLFSFIAIQLTLSSLPLLLFLSFSLGVLLLASITALLFSLFWIGVALFVLVPTLFTTVSLGFLVWVWAVGSFLAARWAYNAIPVSVKGGVEVKATGMGMNGQKVVVKKDEGGFNGEVKEANGSNELGMNAQNGQNGQNGQKLMAKKDEVKGAFRKDVMGEY